MAQESASLVIVRPERVVNLDQFIQTVESVVILACLDHDCISREIAFVSAPDAQGRIGKHTEEAVSE